VGLAAGLAHPFSVGAGDDLALGGFELLHHARVAVELEIVGLLQRQLLVDQALKNLLAGRVGLFRSQATLLLQHEIDLVDGDLGLVDLGGGLAGRFFLLVAATSQQCYRRDQGNKAQAHGALVHRCRVVGQILLRLHVRYDSYPVPGLSRCQRCRQRVAPCHKITAEV